MNALFDSLDPEPGPAAAPTEALPPSQLSLLPGPWTPPAHDGTPSPYRLVTGLMQRETTVKRTVALELLGPGDLLMLEGPQEELMGVRVTFTALTPADLVLLDDRMLNRLPGRPELVGQLLSQAGAQCRRMALHRAICQQPRVEDRLLGVFWLLCERWGHVNRDGVVLPIRLGHEALGRLVGARRPTVSLALKHLAQRGHVRRRTDGTWVIDPETQRGLQCAIEPPSVQQFMLDQPLAPRARRQPAAAGPDGRRSAGHHDGWLADNPGATLRRAPGTHGR